MVNDSMFIFDRNSHRLQVIDKNTWTLLLEKKLNAGASFLSVKFFANRLFLLYRDFFSSQHYIEVWKTGKDWEIVKTLTGADVKLFRAQDSLCWTTHGSNCNILKIEDYGDEPTQK